MPTYKVKILNKEINLNYEDLHKERLIEAINQIKNKIKSIDNLNCLLYTSPSPRDLH